MSRTVRALVCLCLLFLGTGRGSFTLRSAAAEELGRQTPGEERFTTRAMLPAKLETELARLERSETEAETLLIAAAFLLLDAGWECERLVFRNGRVELRDPRPQSLRVARLSGEQWNPPWRDGAFIDDVSRIRVEARDWLEEMDRRGYPFAQVWLRPLDDGGDSPAVEATFQPGPSGPPGELRIVGAKRLSTKFLAQYVALSAREAVSMAAARRGRDRLAASGWFEDLQEPVLGWDPVAERIGVLYRVRERARPNRVAVVLGGGSGETSGALDLDFFSPFGGGRRWRLGADWQGAQRSRLKLDLSEPRFLGRALALDLGFYRVKQDSTYLQQSVQIDLRLLLPAGWQGIAGIGYERSLFQGGIGESEMSRRRYRFGIAWQSVDPGWLGQRHFRLLTDLLKKRSSLPGEAERQNQWEGRLEGLWTQPLRADWKLRSRGGSVLLYAQGRQGFNQAELASVGGAKTLRGYDEEHFRGDRVAHGSLELAYGKQLELFCFLDYGWGRWLRQDQTRVDFTGWGGGLGLLAPSPRGRLSLALALGEEKSLSALRVHLALDAGF